jgi:hypothetical protein
MSSREDIEKKQQQQQMMQQQMMMQQQAMQDPANLQEDGSEQGGREGNFISPRPNGR